LILSKFKRFIIEDYDKLSFERQKKTTYLFNLNILLLIFFWSIVFIRFFVVPNFKTGIGIFSISMLTILSFVFLKMKKWELVKLCVIIMERSVIIITHNFNLKIL